MLPNYRRGRARDRRERGNKKMSRKSRRLRRRLVMHRDFPIVAWKVHFLRGSVHRERPLAVRHGRGEVDFSREMFQSPRASNFAYARPLYLFLHSDFSYFYFSFSLSYGTHFYPEVLAICLRLRVTRSACFARRNYTRHVKTINIRLDSR